MADQRAIPGMGEVAGPRAIPGKGEVAGPRAIPFREVVVGGVGVEGVIEGVSRQ